MSALPYVPVGRAKLIQCEALSDFLRRLNESNSPAETYARMRAEGGKHVRRRLREFSLQDYPASVDSPPRMMTIERGAITVKFQTLEEVAEAMLYLATVFTHDLEGFAELYEPELEVPEEQATTMDESRTEVAFYRDWQPTGKQWKG